MDDIKVFIANLGKYNEGEIVGAWFSPPITNEELTEKLGLNDQYEEYMVQDYEGPIVFSEYSTIGEINAAAEAVEELKSTKLKGVHDTRRGPCTPLLLYSGIEAEAAGCLLAL